MMNAQSGILSGRIVDESKIPLTGATLMIENVKGTNTDVNGYYSFLNLETGTYILNISYIGYEEKQAEITIEGGKNTVINFELTPGVSLQEIVVTSQLRGQARALSSQRSNYNITNIIAADQIGRFPDANIGDAVKRIPGINVQYDQGEARFGNIRGTSPQLNSITINGERVPSAEAEVRSIQLDLIPSDMIQAVEVSKAVTPDMDADAIGGSINLVTRAAPYEQRISGTLGAGYNMLADAPTYNGSLIFGDRFAKKKLGVIFSASYFDNNLGSDNSEAEWTYDDTNDNGQFDDGENVRPEEIQIRQYYLQRIRQSYSLGLDYKLNDNHTVFFKGIYNRRKDWENRYRAVYKDIENDRGQWIAELERQTKGGTEDVRNARLEDQQMMNFSLSGQHLFGKLKMNWSSNYAKASEDRPNERYFEIATDGAVPVEVDFSDPRVPLIAATTSNFQNPSSSWELSEITEEFQFTTDEDVNGKLDFELPLRNGSHQTTLKFGGRLRTKSKQRNNDFYEYEPLSDNFFANSISNISDLSKDNFLAGDYAAGSFTTKEYLGSLDLEGSNFEGEQDLSEQAGNFSASEKIFGGYALINQNFGEDFMMVVGLRLEQSKLEYQGFQYDDEEETLQETAVAKSDYLNVLPGLHMKYNVSPQSILRFAFTNTLARPNYFDLVPYRVIEDGEELSIGNPTLGATTSMNFDLMAEHYFKNVGIVSGGLFYKDISDFIVNQTFDDYTFEGKEWASFSQPINGGNAKLIGAEVAFQRQLDFISPALSGLGIYFNYTYIKSEVTDFNFEGREDEELSLPGSPEHTLNLSLGYEGKKLTSRVSFNYASNFIDEVGGELFEDRYYDEATYLDFNMSYSINPRLVIYANANNLLNQPLRYFQGDSSRTMQTEYYNARFDLGLKFDLIK
ncbi:MAG: TonB-dependent receptor [Halioglobus sp.]|jgi:TonB-dependent receptor